MSLHAYRDMKVLLLWLPAVQMADDHYQISAEGMELKSPELTISLIN